MDQLRTLTSQMPQNYDNEIGILINNLQQRLEAQEQEIQILRAKVAQYSSALSVECIPPVIPRITSSMMQTAPVGQGISSSHSDSLYERFRSLKPPDLDGPSDPRIMEEWLISLRQLLSCMGLTEQEMILFASIVMTKDSRYEWETVELRRDGTRMTWSDFVQEVNQRCYTYRTMKTIQDEFKSIQQGAKTVAEAVRKFEHFARYCPKLVSTEEEKIRTIMMMLRPAIAVVVDDDNKPPKTVADCIDRAVRAEKCLSQEKKNKKRKEYFCKLGGQQKKKIYDNPNPLCSVWKKKHDGECKVGMNVCYYCGNEGHYARQCYIAKFKRPRLNQQNPQGPQLCTLEVRIEGPQANQGGAEDQPVPNTLGFAIAKGDVEGGTSTIDTGQLSIPTQVVLFVDFRILYSCYPIDGAS